MGVGGSKEEEARLASAIHKLSKVEIKRIEDVFQELSFVNAEGKRLIKRPTWLDREQFAEKFGLPDFLGEQLFAAFDRDQNQVVDMNEFLAGMALCLHGNIKDKCRLLFKIFNLNDDEGITREELTTVLSSSLQSAHGVLTGYLKDEEKGTVGWELKIAQTVERIVKDAFDKCDTSRNGRLEIEEFEHWVHKNTKLVNSIFLISCPKPSEDPTSYDVIKTPPDAAEDPFSKGGEQLSSEHESRQHLNELFRSQSVPSKDSEGLSFFDTISGTSDNAGASVSQGLQEASNLEGSAKREVVPSTEVTLDAVTVPLEEPNVPVNADEILHHHLNAPHLQEKIVSRSSEMSLVSLGQSTGDLSSLDAESSEPTETVKGPGEDEGIAKNAVTVGEMGTKLHESGTTAQIREELLENSDDNNKSNLVLDLNLVSEATPDRALDATSPWHPLKPELNPVDDGEEDEENLFQDASDVIQTESDSQIPKIKSGSKTQADEIHEEVLLTAEPDSQSGLGLDVNVQSELASDANQQFGAKPNSSDDVLKRKSDAVKEPEAQSSFEEITDTVIEEESFKRPSSLEVEQKTTMTSVDLSPGEHAIRKPTLRQLAEMQEFDKSPTLEDTNSALPEARLSAWLPSFETRQIIEAINRGMSAEKANLTYPSVLLETSLGDPVKDLVSRFLGEQEASKRPVPTADSVTMNDAGLKSLLTSQCWRGAVDWTAKYLTAHGQGLSSGSPTGPFNHTPKLLQIWFVRIALLFKLRSFSSAEAELNAFGDFENPDLFYEYYPTIYPGMRGSMVPFSLRVIHAELPQHNGRPQETLDRLYRLLSIIRNVLENLAKGHSEFGEEIKELQEEVKLGSIQLWEAREIRILYGTGNCLLSIKEYNLAMKVFTEIIQKKPECKSAILSGVGRLHLQLGDIPLAKKYFKRVELISSGDPKTLTITVMNRGFAALAEGKYNEAFENFQSVTKLDPDNSSAWNNASVALLFQGKVKEACTLLETLIWKSPKKNLHEDIILNLCTIYELETSRALQKKHKLLDLVCRHKGDGFNVQSLKLT